MARSPNDTSKPALPNKPRNNNFQTSSGNNNNVGRNGSSANTGKSASLVGMETWAKTTQAVLKNRQVDIANTPHKDIADKAYSIYNRMALHSELRALHKAHPDLSMNGSKLTGKQATAEMQKARTNSGKAKHLSFIDNANNRNNSTDTTSYLHVDAKDTSKIGRKLTSNSEKEKSTGFSARLSLTSDAFFDEKKQPGIYDKNGLKRKVTQQTEFGNLAAATLEWTKSEKNASGAKIMGPGKLNKGRADHAVLYATSGDNAEQQAQKYSNMIKHGSKRVPLGMEPMADGVAYAELLNHTKGAFAPGYSTANEHLGTSRKMLQSFGTNRANIIAAAIESHNQSGNKSTLNQNLRDSIKAHGYRTSNPARVNKQGSAYKDFKAKTNSGVDKFDRQKRELAALQSNSNNSNSNSNSNNRNTIVSSGNANVNLNHRESNKRNQAIVNTSGQMQSLQTQATQKRAAKNKK